MENGHRTLEISELAQSPIPISCLHLPMLQSLRNEVIKMIEVLFLGVGSAIPMPGQTNSSYILRPDDTCLLIDCGPAILQQLSAVGMSPASITHVYFTHRHGDHSLG